jgi:LacI family transcriptional regulator
MNMIDELGEAGAKPTYLRDGGVKMRDVAVAAGVSVATVSNVINHPHMVAPGTKERVQCIVRELTFSPIHTLRRCVGGAGVS